MAHKCFISFKMEDAKYKDLIQYELKVDMINKSLNEPIDSNNEDYIMRKIREDYLADSTVTIHLIGNHSAEAHNDNQNYIKRELQASLFNGEDNTKNGILGIVLPHAYTLVYKGGYKCNSCGNQHNFVSLADTTVKEFSYNYYIPVDNKCSWSEDDRYCVLVKWDDFVLEPEKYINKAFDKRTHTISQKTKVRP